MKLRDTLERSRTITIAPPSGTVSQGAVVQVNDIFCFAFSSAQNTNEQLANYAESVTMIYDAIAVATKTIGAINAGDLVYLSGQNVTTVSTGNRLIGVALESAQSSAAEVLIHFDGIIGGL